MDPEREDYRDEPDPPPNPWGTKRVLWLLLPIALAPPDTRPFIRRVTDSTGLTNWLGL